MDISMDLSMDIHIHGNPVKISTTVQDTTKVTIDH